jgi:hypothetical protein
MPGDPPEWFGCSAGPTEAIAMLKGILIIGAVLMLWSSSAATQVRPAAGACLADIKTHCSAAESAQDRVPDCMKEHIKELSDRCQTRLARYAIAARRTCAPDIKQHCADVKPGRGRIRDCLKSSLANLSDACKDAIVQAVARRR